MHSTIRAPLACLLLIAAAALWPGPGLGQEVGQDVARGAYLYTLRIPYGVGPGQAGKRAGPGAPMQGPESLAVGPDGDVYLCDTVNGRVLRFPVGGAEPRAIEPDADLRPGDIAVDDRGRLYLLDSVEGAVVQLDPDGAVLARTPVEPGAWRARSGLHLTGGTLYMADAAQRDHLLARLDRHGQMAAPAKRALPRSGRLAASGRRYLVELARGEVVVVHAFGQGGSGWSRQMDSPGAVSARFLAEDAAGNAWLRVERALPAGLALEVWRLDGMGRRTGVVELFDTDYAAWTARMAAVGPDGLVAQLVPGDYAARVHVFRLPVEAAQ